MFILAADGLGANGDYWYGCSGNIGCSGNVGCQLKRSEIVSRHCSSVDDITEHCEISRSECTYYGTVIECNVFWYFRYKPK